jgi:predicted CDP-diglyceride synthetase/phosphatidate cytidylyltransferase
MAACLIITFSNFLQVISAFEFIGILVLTIYRMLTGDLLKFLLVYTTLLYGLALAIYVLGHDAFADHATHVEFSANDVSVY